MDVDKECSAMGALFQQIITDMKVMGISFTSHLHLIDISLT